MDKVRVCFVIPPSVFLLDERVFMSLGILKVAAVAQKYYAVDVLDLSGVVNYGDVLNEYIKNNSNVIFGITTTTPQLPKVSELVNIIRFFFTRCR